MEQESYCSEQSDDNQVLNNETLNDSSSVHMLSPIIPNNGNNEIIPNQNEANKGQVIIDTDDSSSVQMFSPIIPTNNNTDTVFNQNYLQNGQGANNAEEIVKTFQELNGCFEQVNKNFIYHFSLYINPHYIGEGGGGAS